MAAMSIVVTAVYVLRAIGRTVMGPITNNEYLTLQDAAWHERTAAIVLIAGILAMGIAPGWIVELITPGAQAITERIGNLP
jgi:NADH-quinone oxidoreductase subunit M